MNEWRDDDEILCHCRNVTAGAVRATVRDRGASKPDEVSRLCRAGTGCRSCLPDIETIVAQERAARSGKGPIARFLKFLGVKR